MIEQEISQEEIEYLIMLKMQSGISRAKAMKMILDELEIIKRNRREYDK